MNSYLNIFRNLLLLTLTLAISSSVVAQQKKNKGFDSDVTKQVFTYADSLQLDFYSLEKAIDANRLLLVVMHGGGFSGGKRDSPAEVTFAQQMALKGYAVASISYRLTRKGKSFSCDCPSQEKMETFVAAAEDVSKAVLFLHERKNELGFNPNQTILIGSSAGAEGVLNTVFMKDHYSFAHIPKFPVAGIISLAGAVINTGYINKENKVPVLFFHGMKDNLVPYATAAHHYCKNDTEGYLILEGAASIAERLKELNTSYVLAFDPEGKHEWAGDGYKQLVLINEFLETIILNNTFLQKTIQLKE